MKKLTVVMLLTLAVTLGAYAADQSFTLSQPEVVNGQTIAAGHYDVRYVVHGSSAEVKWLKEGKTIATATGQVAQSDRKSEYNFIDTARNASGETQIKEVHFQGKTDYVQFSNDAAANGK